MALMNILIQNRQTNTLRGVFTRVEAEEDVLLKWVEEVDFRWVELDTLTMIGRT